MSARVRLQRGFTLLEMALVLFTTGFLFAALPKLMVQAADVLAVQPGATPSEQARLALTGFVVRHHRLPCPSTTALGGEEAASCTNSQPVIGYLPYKALGLPGPLTNRQGFDFRYGVHAGLAAATTKFTPTYDDSGANYWTAASALAVNATERNRLDFCARLRELAAATESSPDANYLRLYGPAGVAQSVNVAWALVDPGENGVLEGYNAAPGAGLQKTLDSAGRDQSPTYDDKVSAAGLSQFLAETQCPRLLSSISAAAREADFSHENWRVLAFLRDLREFERDMRNLNDVMAGNMLLLAQFNIALTAAMSTLDLGIALASASGAASIAVSIVNSVIAITMAVTQLIDAQDKKDETVAEKAEGVSRLNQAEAALTNAAAFRTSRRTALQELDLRGAFQ